MWKILIRDVVPGAREKEREEDEKGRREGGKEGEGWLPWLRKGGRGGMEEEEEEEAAKAGPMMWEGGGEGAGEGGLAALTELRLEEEEEASPERMREEFKAQETAAVDR